MTTLEFLEGFEQRMQLVAAIDSIINRLNRKMEFERLFEAGQLDNIILSVLVFIMERTLTEDEDCTMDSITNCVAQIIAEYSLNLTSDVIQKADRIHHQGHSAKWGRGQILSSHEVRTGDGTTSDPTD